MTTVKPTFPALQVHEDGSIGPLLSLEDWTHDVDQWFWSEPDVYIIDSLGLKFVQECERASDRRPVDVPVWKFDSRLEEAVIRSLIVTFIGAPVKEDQAIDRGQRIRNMINLVIEFDSY